MGSFDNYWEAGILSHVFRIAALTQCTIWIGLSTSTAVTADEVAGAGYVRYEVQLTNCWAAPTGTAPSTVTNATQFTFATSISNYSANPITHLFMSNTSLSGAGNVMAVATLNVSKTVGTDDVVVVGTGSLSVTLN